MSANRLDLTGGGVFQNVYSGVSPPSKAYTQTKLNELAIHLAKDLRGSGRFNYLQLLDGLHRALKAAEVVASEKPDKAKPKADMVNHPPHYTAHPEGLECIQVTRHMPFCEGNAVKYIWRVVFGDKAGARKTEDLEKAIFYLREAVKLRR